MKKPLNIITHIKSNIKGILPTILTLGLEFVALIFMIAIGVGVLYSVDYNLGASLYKVAVIEDSIDVNKDEIESFDSVERVIQGEVTYGSGMLPIANLSVMFIKVDTDEMDYVMNHMEAKVIEGRLPEKYNEIVLTTYGANTANVKVGDYVGTEYGDVLYLRGNYKVVGIIKSKYNFYLGYSNNKNKSIISIRDNKGRELEESLKEYCNKETSITSYDGISEFSDTMSTILAGLGVLAIGLFSLGIWISSVNLTKANIKNLIGEYRILRFLGYKKSFIRRRVSSQLLLIMLLSAIVGIVLGGFINIIFNNLYCIPRGIAYSEFNLYIIIIPIVVALILFVLSSISTKKIIDKLDFSEEI